jgi:DNA helicase HerA-like ATPase
MHSLIIGRTFTGKSALAKMTGAELRKQGYEVLAFNPTGERGYMRPDDEHDNIQAAEWESSDPEIFAREILQRLQTPKKRFIIIDECHEFFSRGDCAYLWIGTKGRHYGLNVIGISQRGALVNPTFRGMCATLYLFACSATDAKFISDEFGNPKLREATSLPPKHFYKIRHNELTFHKLP